jgi:hypothetical protein
VSLTSGASLTNIKSRNPKRETQIIRVSEDPAIRNQDRPETTQRGDGKECTRGRDGREWGKRMRGRDKKSLGG